MSNRKSRVMNANKRLPENLSELLVEEVFNLPSCPKADHLKREFLKKFVSKDTDPEELRRERAITKWLATEDRNKDTNERLINTHPEFQILRDVSAQKFFAKVTEIVSDIIGDLPPEETLYGGFSGGASTSRNRTEAHPALKYLGKAHVTADALHWVPDLVEMCPPWANAQGTVLDNIEIVSGNRMFTVPKTTDIDRVACKEPDINMFLQRGCGDYIRRSLKRVGIDLNDQSRNRDLARRGSIDGSLATVDLSSASDSITRNLVWTVLPSLWFSHLDSLRSPITTIPDWNGSDHEHVNEMFSSMGNGFTFELESLIFYSLARAVAYFTGTSGVISVYGDDIIIPAQMYHDLEWVFSYCGFTVNGDKSFYEGPFRESCGGHFMNGLDVTPFYLRAPIERYSDLMLFLNQLRHWSESPVGVNDPSVYPLWEFGASFIPNKFWGAEHYGTRTQMYGPARVSRPVQLLPRRRTVDNGPGAYMFWLNTASTRTRAGLIETSTRAVEDTRLFEERRVRCSVNLDFPIFQQEDGRSRVTN